MKSLLRPLLLLTTALLVGCSGSSKSSQDAAIDATSADDGEVLVGETDGTTAGEVEVVEEIAENGDGDAGATECVDDQGCPPATDPCERAICRAGRCEVAPILWQSEVGGPGYDRAHALAQNGDGLWAVGATSSLGAGAQDVWLLALDAGGGVQRQLAWGLGGQDVALAAATIEDGLVAVGVSEDDAGDDDVVVMRVSSAGHVVSQRVARPGDDVARAVIGLRPREREVVPRSSHASVALVGWSVDEGGRETGWLWRVDGAGAVVGESGLAGRGYGVAELGDRLLVTGIAGEEADERDAFVSAVDANDELAWQVTLGGAKEQAGLAVVLHGAGVAVLVRDQGSTRVVHLSADGQIVWERAFDGERPAALARIGTGGLALVTTATTAGEGVAVLQRLDADGNTVWRAEVARGIGVRALAVTGLDAPQRVAVAVAMPRVGGGEDTLVQVVDAWGSSTCEPDTACLAVTPEDCGPTCAEVSCDPALGCVSEPMDSRCDDANPCTTGVCGAAGCQQTPRVGSCDDGDDCTLDDRCADGVCSGQALECDDGNVCTDDRCDPEIGCVTVDNDAACDDLDLCTGDGVCSEGHCTPGIALECDDGDACTNDGCDPAVGCTTTPVACDDGDACTSDGCDAVTGCTTTPVDCDDGDACTTDGCDAVTGCTTLAVDCDDGKACTVDGCDPVTGCTNVATGCDDGDACTVDGCDDAIGCTTSPLECDDGDACTVDGCDPATGCTATPIACDDGDACTVDHCDPTSGCGSTPLDCDDGDACTVDGCDAAAGCTTAPLDCDDGDACTTDHCDPALGCVNTPVVCNDGNACTTDSCDARVGCVTTPVVCDDGSACTTDSCNPATGCTTTSVICDDGDSCTTDSCNPSVGCTTQPIDCDDGDPCTTDGCSAQTGCTHQTIDCDDGDACTTDSCDGQGGCDHDERSCDDGDPCTTDSCNSETGCANEPFSCDDNDACTEDICDGQGGCQNNEIDCSDGDLCTTDSCDTLTGCSNEPLDCDDGDPCTIGDTCVGGSCVTGTPKDCDDEDACTADSCDGDGVCQNEPLDCDDGDPCTNDACQEEVGCVSTPFTGACDDGDPCTTGETCGEEGLCIPTAASVFRKLLAPVGEVKAIAAVEGGLIASYLGNDYTHMSRFDEVGALVWDIEMGWTPLLVPSTSGRHWFLAANRLVWVREQEDQEAGWVYVDQGLQATGLDLGTLFGIAPVPPGDHAVAAYRHNNQAVFRRFDSSFAEVWSKTYAGASVTVPRAAAPYPGDRTVIVGQVSSADPTVALWIIANSDGGAVVELYPTIPNEPQGTTILVYRVFVQADGTAVALLYDTSDESRFWTVRFDDSGSYAFSAAYNLDLGSESLETAAMAPDGSILLTRHPSQLTLLDPVGNLVAHRFADRGVDPLRTIAAAPDGGFYLGGEDSRAVQSQVFQGAQGSELGAALAANEDLAAIGAPGAAGPGGEVGAGSVDVYTIAYDHGVERDVLTLDTTLYADPPLAGAGFGRSVVVCDDFIVAVATDSEVILYEDAGGSWSEVARTDEGATGPMAAWCRSSKRRIIVGAPDLEPAGGAFVYQRQSDGSWPLLATLQPALAPTGAGAGEVVFGDGEGGGVLLGAPDEAGGGAVYSFTLSGEDWTETRIAAPDAQPGDRFGASIASFGEVAIGAPGAGKIYLYGYSGWSPLTHDATLDRGLEGFGSSLQIGPDYSGAYRLSVGMGDGAGSRGRIEVYVWDHPSDTPMLSDTIEGTPGAQLGARIGGSWPMLIAAPGDGQGAPEVHAYVREDRWGVIQKVDIWARGSCRVGTACETLTPADCNDGDGCTSDDCDLVDGCPHSAVYADAFPCADDDGCTTGETCQSSTCTAGQNATCDDDNPCTDDACDGLGGCTNTPRTGACDDGDPCTENTTCDEGGACGGGTTTSCDDGDACTVDSCDVLGGCSNEPIDCDDGDLCTNDACEEGVGCVSTPFTGACDDGDPCTTGETCGVEGLCVPTAAKVFRMLLPPFGRVLAISSVNDGFIASYARGENGDGFMGRYDAVGQLVWEALNNDSELLALTSTGRHWYEYGNDRLGWVLEQDDGDGAWSVQDQAQQATGLDLGDLEAISPVAATGDVIAAYLDQSQAVFRRFDSSFAETWSQTYQDGGTTTSPRAAAPYPDNRTVIVGQTTTQSTVALWIIDDEDGLAVLEQYPSIPGETANISVYKVFAAPDGSALALLHDFNSAKRFWTVRFDAGGSIAFSARYELDQGWALEGAAMAPDGSILLNRYFHRLLLLDPAGNLVAQRHMDREIGFIHTIAPAHDGGFYLGGELQRLEQADVVTDTAATELGASLAGDDDYLAIGSPGADGSGGEPGAGSVAVYTTDSDGMLTPETTLYADPDLAGDGFGRSVGAFSCGLPTVAVASDTDVYIYEMGGSGWAEAARTTEGATGTLSLGCDVLVVGDPELAPAGGAYVYRRQGDGSWPLEATLTSSLAPAGAGVGSVVVADADDQGILLGAPDEDGGGAVYAFVGSGSDWTETRITAPDAAPGDRFGGALASRNEVVIGAPGGGKVYIYGFNGWDPLTLDAALDRGIEGFGSSVQITDGSSAFYRIAVGHGDAARGRGVIETYEWQYPSDVLMFMDAIEGDPGDHLGAKLGGLDVLLAAAPGEGSGDREVRSYAVGSNGGVIQKVDIWGRGTCSVGTACETLIPVDCRDGDGCTSDDCDLIAGCPNTEVYTNGFPCADSDACTTRETCQSATCTPGETASCDDANPCTEDACDGLGGCTYTPTTGACDDGDPCTENTTCDAGGECGGGTTTNCDDGDACTVDSCEPDGGCVNDPIDCDDGDPCTTDACEDGVGCVSTPFTGACDDGDACTSGEVCGDDGLCVPTDATVFRRLLPPKSSSQGYGVRAVGTVSGGLIASYDGDPDRMARHDEAGNPVWEITATSSELLATSSSGRHWYAPNSTNIAWVRETDDGQGNWSFVEQDSPSPSPVTGIAAIAAVDDGDGVVVASSSGGQALIQRFESDFSLSWAKTFTGPGDTRPWAAAPYPGDRTVIVGAGTAFENPLTMGLWIVDNDDGNPVLEIYPEHPDADYLTRLRQVFAHPDGHAVALAADRTSRNRFWVIRFDASGSVSISAPYVMGRGTIIYAAAMAGDGSILLPRDFYLLPLLDPQGSVIAVRALDRVINEVNSIAPAPDGGFYLGGITHALKQVETITGQLGDELGAGLADDLDGTAAIGVPGAPGPGAEAGAGAVEVYQLGDDATLSPETTLYAVPAVAGDGFGRSVAAYSGYERTIAVASDTNVYIFEDDGGGWTQVAKTEEGATGPLSLGYGYLAVGAPDLEPAGGVHLYVRQPDGSWPLDRTLQPTLAQAGARAGTTVSLDVYTFWITIGAPDEAGGGAAYLFRTSDGVSWTESRITAPDAQADDAFGGGVATLNGVMVIGAPGAGKVYLFESSADETYFEVMVDRGLQGFGRELHLTDLDAWTTTRLAVGLGDAFGGRGLIETYLWNHSGPLMLLDTDEGGPGERLGARLAPLGEDLIVAAPGDGSGPPAVRTYDFEDDHGVIQKVDVWGRGRCSVGTACETLTPADCSDGVPCTSDDCDLVAGCPTSTVHADDLPCGDDDACTTGETCQSGTCTPGETAACDDNNPCTDDACDGLGGCIHTPNDVTSCDDSDNCTDGDTCVEGVCTGTDISATLCPAVSDCGTPVCVHSESDPGYTCEGGAFDPGDPCNDGDGCTENTTCDESGDCIGGNQVSCEDGDDCTIDYCAGGSCQNDPMDCDDGNACTTDGCSAGVCTHDPITGSCDDGDDCTLGDTCGAGGCLPTAARSLYLVREDATVLHDVARHPGGGMVAVGEDATAPGPPGSIFRWDAGGNEQWKETTPLGVGGSITLRAVSVDERVWAVGHQGVAWVTETETDGVWSRDVFKSAAFDSASLQDVEALADGSAIVTGISTGGQIYSARLAPDDTNTFSILSEDITGPVTSYGAQVVPRGDGSFLIVGQTSNDPAAPAIVLVDGDAQVISESYPEIDGAASPFLLRDIGREGSPRVAIGVEAGESGSSDLWWLTIDPSTLAVNKTMRISGLVGVSLVQRNGEGSAVVASAGAEPQLLRFGETGELHWQRELGGSATWSIAPASDDFGYYLAGAMVDQGLLTKVDRWGRFPCTPGSLCDDIAVSTCDDGMPCTVDDCAGAIGCLPTHAANPDGLACDDGVVCESGDFCLDGMCNPGFVPGCDDGDPCTIASCDADPSTCEHLPVDCDDGSVCTTDSCDGATGFCVHTPVDVACDDGDPCTSGDRCWDGVCMGSDAETFSYHPSGRMWLYAVAALSDGYVAGGWEDDWDEAPSWTVRLGLGGEVHWTTDFGGLSNANIEMLAPGSDRIWVGGQRSVGWITEAEDGQGRYEVTGYAAPPFSSNLGSSSIKIYAMAASVAEDAVIVVGDTGGNPYRVYVAKVTPQIGIPWTATFTGPDLDYTRATEVHHYAGYGYVVVGGRAGSNAASAIWAVAEDGTVLREDYIEGGQQLGLLDPSRSNPWIAVASNFTVTRFWETLTPAPTSIMVEPASRHSSGVLIASDGAGGLLTLPRAWFEDYEHWGAILALDPSDNVRWEQRLPYQTPPVQPSFQDATSTPDGGMVTAGWGTDFFLVPEVVSGRAGEDYGAAVSSDGWLVAVGAPGRTGDGGELQVGAVELFYYPYEDENTPFGLLAELRPDPQIPGDRFGQSVFAYDDAAIVGADSGPYVFDQQSDSSDNWLQTDHLTTPGASGAVAYWEGTEETVFVAAERADDDAGAVYVYSRPSPSDPWGLDDVIVPYDTYPGQRFGTTLAACRTGNIFVGVPHDGNVAYDQGAVYAFDLVDGTWTQSYKIVAPDGAAGDLLGAAMTCGVVAAPGAGRVYAGTWSASTWSLGDILEDPNDGFGASVGWTPFVGNPELAGGAGGATVYWPPQPILTYLNDVPNQRFGAAMADYEPILVVGAPGGETVPGQAYIFSHDDDEGSVVFRTDPWGRLTCGATAKCGAGPGACDDGDPCTADICDLDSGCVHEAHADGTACPGNGACDRDGVCMSGVCVTAACDDTLQCTLDVCDPADGSCSNPNRTGPCDDGDACTMDDTCQAGTCQPGEEVDCDDGDACTTDSCDESGGCTNTVAVTCDEGPACGTGSCDPETGACVYALDDSQCTDSVGCTIGRCTLVGCEFIPDHTSCDDAFDCTIDTCDPQDGCHYESTGAACCSGEETFQATCTDDVCDWGTPIADCDAQDQVCVDGACVECARDADCPGQVACGPSGGCYVPRCVGGSCVVEQMDTVPHGCELASFDIDTAGSAVSETASTTFALGPMQTYCVRVEGTWSLWPDAAWDSSCGGAPDAQPLYPSPAHANGRVGLDPRYAFALPIEAEECGEALPYEHERLLFRDDGEVSSDGWRVPAWIGDGVAAGHGYAFEISDGQEEVLALRLSRLGAVAADAYGQLRVQVFSGPCSAPPTIEQCPEIATGLPVHVASASSTVESTGFFTSDLSLAYESQEALRILLASIGGIQTTNGTMALTLNGQSRSSVGFHAGDFEVRDSFILRPEPGGAAARSATLTVGSNNSNLKTLGTYGDTRTLGVIELDGAQGPLPSWSNTATAEEQTNDDAWQPLPGASFGMITSGAPLWIGLSAPGTTARSPFPGEVRYRLVVDDVQRALTVHQLHADLQRDARLMWIEDLPAGYHTVRVDWAYGHRLGGAGSGAAVVSDQNQRRALIAFELEREGGVMPYQQVVEDQRWSTTSTSWTTIRGGRIELDASGAPVWLNYTAGGVEARDVVDVKTQFRLLIDGVERVLSTHEFHTDGEDLHDVTLTWLGLLAPGPHVVEIQAQTSGGTLWMSWWRDSRVLQAIELMR